MFVASTDGGLSWTDVNSPYVGQGSQPSSMSCFGPQRCVVAGTTPGNINPTDVFVTGDGGVSWQQATIGGSPGGPGVVGCAGTMCVGFSVVYAGNDFPYASDDGGQQWSRVVPNLTGGNGGSPIGATGAAVQDFWCAAPSSCLAVGGWHGGPSIARSTDGGSSWSGSVLPVALENVDTVACWSPEACLAGGSSSTGAALALRTSDGGRRWRSVSLPSGLPSLVALVCPGPRRCVALTGSQPASGLLASVSYILVTTDGGSRWKVATGPTGSLESFACPSVGICVAVGGQPASPESSSTAVVSSDGGADWKQMRVPQVGDLVAVSCPSTVRCVALGSSTVRDGVATSGSVLVAIRHGGRWTWATVGRLPAALADSGLVGTGDAEALSCPALRQCFTVTSQRPPGPAHRGGPPAKAIVLESDDAGHSWSTVARAPAGDQSFTGIACRSTSACVTVGQALPHRGAAIAVTADGGTRWHADVLPAGVAQLSWVECPRAGRCQAAGELVGSAAILTTDDGGRSWRTDALPPWVEIKDEGPQ